MSQKIGATCLKFSCIAIFMLLFQVSYAQKNSKEFGVDKFPELNDLLIRNQKALGTDVVAVVWADTMVFKKEMGEFNSRTLAPVASASKWFTAALVMQFVDEGKISLEDKVSDYLPVFSKYGKNYITIRHCLTNYTGIQAEGSKLFEKKKFASLEEEVNSFAAREIQTNPGTESRYSDIGFSIAGRVLEVVAKKRFDMLIKQKLFKDVGMRLTTFSTMDGSAVDPANGAKSTADDFTKFMVMLMNGGEINGKKILSKEAVDLLLTIHATADKIKGAPKATNGYNYALGSWAVETEGEKATAVTNPGLSGVWPLIDMKRKYVYLILPKALLNDPKADTYLEVKKSIDEVRSM